MKKENVKMFKKFFVLLGLFIALFSAITTNVEAGKEPWHTGDGGDNTIPGSGDWLVNEGPTAFEDFINAVAKARSAKGSGINTKEKLYSHIDSIGQGAVLPNGKRESLSATCQRSETVMWYGSASKGGSYPQNYWFTEAKNTHNVPSSNWQPMSVPAKSSFNTYKAQSSKWTSGKVILVCSAMYDDTPVGVPITVRAKSKTVTYDGNNHTVSGHDITDGKLKSGHKEKVTAKRTARDVGSYSVPVSSVTITDKDGKDVTGEYAITTREGTLRIIPELPTGDDNQCVRYQTDTASAIVETVTTGSHGYTPNGAGSLQKIEEVNITIAGEYRSSVPSVNSSISTWNEWKANFEGGSSTETPEIDLASGGVSETLSKHGGVYNVLKTLREDTYTVEHCQPQIRYLEDKTKTVTSEETITKPDGSTETIKVEDEIEYQEWSEWEDSGERRLTKVSGPVRTEEHSNYQILSVNCNLDGFNSVKNSTGGDVIAIGNGDGSAALKTPIQEGRTPGNLPGDATTSSFYTDGKSCDIFKCTVKQDDSVLNDAKNNKGNTNLFGEVLEDGTVGETNDDGELVFFRDNEDRQVRADLWYPKDTGLADLDAHSGDPAKNTFVKIYDDSTSDHVNPTPEIELTTIAPWNNESDKIEDTGVIKKYANEEINRFNIKSQWASEDGAPYQLGANWEYKATGKNVIPTIVNGEEIISTQNYSHPFDVYCEFRNEANEEKAVIPKTPYANGSTSPEWDPSNAIRTLFSRSASAMD